MFRTPTAVLLCSLLTSSLATLPVAAQSRRAIGGHPDFSGTWVMDTGRSESARADAGTRVDSATVVITQSPANVLMESVRNGAREVARYPLQGGEPPKAVGTSGSIGTIVEWDGSTLVTSTPHEVNGMAVTTTERRSLSADGREMTVTTVLTIQHGYEGPSGKNYSSPITDVYVLKSR